MGDGGPVAGELIVDGLADLQRAFARADKDSKRDVRKVMRGIAEPTAKSAEGSALANISGLARTRQPKWHGMRVGVTRNLIYVAPKQRGRFARANPKLHRRNMRELLRTRSLDPAQAKYSHTYEAAVGRAFEQIADRFNRGA